MSNIQVDDDYDDDTSTADLPEPARKRLRQLEKENKRIGELERQNAELQRQQAIHGAGLSDLSEMQMKALATMHEGESTPEGLRRTAESLGFVQPPPAVNPADVAAHNALADARTGGTNVEDRSYEEEVATAKSRDELHAIAMKHNRPWNE